MDTLFLFEAETGGYPLIGLSDTGEVVLPFAHYDVTEMSHLISDKRLVFVIRTERATIHRVLLPKLHDKKARLAIYYALEDALATGQDTVHLAFERRYVEDGYYRVIAIQQETLKALLKPLAEHHIHPDAVTVDWFVLKPEERFIRENTVLIYDDMHFSGALCGEIANQYLMHDNNPALIETYQSTCVFKPNQQPLNTAFFVWASQRLRRAGFIDLQQGEFAHHKGIEVNKTWYIAVAASVLVWLGSVLLANGLAIHHLNKALDQTNAAINKQYFHFFPHATTVINPRFRITQLLKNRTPADNTCFVLLNALATTVGKHPVTIESIRFEQNTLTVALESQQVEVFDTLEQALIQQKMHVTQSQVTTHGDTVTGTLELHR